MNKHSTMLDNSSKPNNLASFSIKFGIKAIMMITIVENNQTKAYFTGILFFNNKYKTDTPNIMANPDVIMGFPIFTK